MWTVSESELGVIDLPVCRLLRGLEVARSPQPAMHAAGPRMSRAREMPHVSGLPQSEGDRHWEAAAFDGEVDLVGQPASYITGQQITVDGGMS